MRHIFIVVGIQIFFGLTGIGQTGLNKMINVPDSINLKLAHYLQQAEKLDTLYTAIYVYRVVASTNNKYSDDVYQFRLMGPHYRMRVFINNNGETKIFENAYTLGLLKEFYEYIAVTNISEEKKIRYLNSIALFLKNNYEQ